MIVNWNYLKSNCFLESVEGITDWCQSAVPGHMILVEDSCQLTHLPHFKRNVFCCDSTWEAILCLVFFIFP